jgi:hypothetical protein
MMLVAPSDTSPQHDSVSISSDIVVDSEPNRVTIEIGVSTLVFGPAWTEMVGAATNELVVPFAWVRMQLTDPDRANDELF